MEAPTDTKPDSNHPPPPDSTITKKRFLIGPVGADYIREGLSKVAPVDFIEKFQRENGLGAGRVGEGCEPVLPLLDLHGVSRCSLNKAVMERVRERLIKKIELEENDSQALVKLLERSFPYVSFPELKRIPFAIMQKLPRIPGHYLATLSATEELYEECSIEIRRQIWESDIPLYTETVIRPVLEEYIMKQERMRILANDLSGVGVVPPKKRRGASKVVRQLVDSIGRSLVLYRVVMDSLRTLYANTANDMYCSLRAQLLMAMHDEGLPEIYSEDPCHKFAWCVDACIRDRDIGKRVKEIDTYFEALEVAEMQREQQRMGGGVGGTVEEEEDVDHHVTIVEDGRGDNNVKSEGTCDDTHQGGKKRKRNTTSDTAIPASDVGMVIEDPFCRNMIIRYCCEQIIKVVLDFSDKESAQKTAKAHYCLSKHIEYLPLLSRVLLYGSHVRAMILKREHVHDGRGKEPVDDEEPFKLPDRSDEDAINLVTVLLPFLHSIAVDTAYAKEGVLKLLPDYRQICIKKQSSGPSGRRKKMATIKATVDADMKRYEETAKPTIMNEAVEHIISTNVVAQKVMLHFMLLLFFRVYGGSCQLYQAAAEGPLGGKSESSSSTMRGDEAGLDRGTRVKHNSSVSGIENVSGEDIKRKIGTSAPVECDLVMQNIVFPSILRFAFDFDNSEEYFVIGFADSVIALLDDNLISPQFVISCVFEHFLKPLSTRYCSAHIQSVRIINHMLANLSASEAMTTLAYFCENGKLPTPRENGGVEENLTINEDKTKGEGNGDMDVDVEGSSKTLSPHGNVMVFEVLRLYRPLCEKLSSRSDASSEATESLKQYVSKLEGTVCK
eukprot:Nk52_evm66s32 gene=Nk52_evmTU66s32